MADDTAQGQGRRKRRVGSRKVSSQIDRCDSHKAESAKWASFGARLRISLFYWPQALFFSLLFAAALSTTTAVGAALAKAVELSPTLVLFAWAAASLIVFLFIVFDTFHKFGVAASIISQVRADFTTNETCSVCVAEQRKYEEEKVRSIIDKLENGADITLVGRKT